MGARVRDRARVHRVGIGGAYSPPSAGTDRDGMSISTLTEPQPTRVPVPPVLDVVIPVYNEENDLASCVRRLHARATALPLSMTGVGPPLLPLSPLRFLHGRLTLGFSYRRQLLHGASRLQLSAKLIDAIAFSVPSLRNATYPKQERGCARRS